MNVYKPPKDIFVTRLGSEQARKLFRQATKPKHTPTVYRGEYKFFFLSVKFESLILPMPRHPRGFMQIAARVVCAAQTHPYKLLAGFHTGQTATHTHIYIRFQRRRCSQSSRGLLYIVEKRERELTEEVSARGGTKFLKSFAK